MIVDAAVHPVPPDEAYRERLQHPWRDAMNLVPSPFGKLYEPPAAEVEDREAAGDPDALAASVFGAGDVEAAILTPLTRGLLPNPQHLDAVARATNDWLHERFLSGSEPRWFGSIRVAVTDPGAAVREIDRWAGEPRFVQVAVPLRAYDQYGDPRYLPIWEAAAAHDLTVVVLDDRASGAELVRSPVGQPLTFAEDDALRPMLSIVHLASLVMSGVFDRLPSLQFVFADGGADHAAPMLWRVDKDWRSGRVETPWVTELPSAIAQRHATFVTQAQDGTTDGVTPAPDLARIGGAASRVLYGSRRPLWDAGSPQAAVAALDTADHEAVLRGNALTRIPRLAAQLAAVRA